jgi:hypothetical protein
MIQVNEHISDQVNEWQCGTYHFEQAKKVTILQIEHPNAKCAISLFGGKSSHSRQQMVMIYCG